MNDDSFDNFLFGFFVVVVVTAISGLLVWFGYELNDNQYENCKIEIIEKK